MHLILLVLLFFAACDKDKPVERHMLLGRYRTSYSHGSEILWLNTDGTFGQVYTPYNNGQAVTNFGRWIINDDFTDVVLRNAIVFDKWGHRSQEFQQTVWQLAVMQRFGQISLSRDREKVLEFRKETDMDRVPTFDK